MLCWDKEKSGRVVVLRWAGRDGGGGGGGGGGGRRQAGTVVVVPRVAERWWGSRKGWDMEREQGSRQGAVGQRQLPRWRRRWAAVGRGNTPPVSIRVAPAEEDWARPPASSPSSFPFLFFTAKTSHSHLFAGRNCHMGATSAFNSRLEDTQTRAHTPFSFHVVQQGQRATRERRAKI